MQKLEIIKKVTSCAAVMLTILATTASVNAYTILSQSKLQLDTSITRDDVNYNTPTKVVIVPIYPSDSQFKFSSDDLYRGVYYYTIDKLGFNDIPFHYIAAEDGKVFAGNSGGDERKIRIEGVGDDVIVIGYLANNFSSSFTPQGLETLKVLVSDVVNKNSLSPNKISVSGIKFVRNQSTKSVAINSTKLYGTWNLDIAQVKDYARSHYHPKPKKYNIQILSVAPPSEKVSPGQSVKVQIKLKNLYSTGLYGDSSSEAVLTKVGGGFSIFYLNNEWLSQSQVSLMGDGEILLPYHEGTFEILVKAPLYVGKVTEKFELKTIEGKAIDSNKVNLTLDMKAPKLPIIQILQTETGALNVRGTPSSVGAIVSQVSPGQRFFKTGDAGNGFIQIKLNNGTKGWVLNRYIKYVYP